MGQHATSVGDANFDGLIDDLSIWSVWLDSYEIGQIYHRQKQKYAGHFDSEVFDKGSATSIWPDLSWSTELPFGKELVGDFDNDLRNGIVKIGSRRVQHAA